MMPPRKIYVDPGHGGADPGAVGNGLREADIALAISKKVADHLRRHGLEVRMSRDGNQSVSLPARTNDANRWGAHAYVSIHCNAGPASARGFEVWHTIHEARSQGDELARSIVAWMGRLTRIPNRGTKTKPSEKNPNLDYYHVIRETKAPAVIVEAGFVSNPEDAAYLCSADGQAAIAEAIARGVVEWAGLTWQPAAPSGQKPAAAPKAEPKPQPKPAAKPGPFRDVPADHPAADAIGWLKARGIAQGYPDGTYRPDQPVSRAEMALFLYRALAESGRS